MNFFKIATIFSIALGLLACGGGSGAEKNNTGIVAETHQPLPIISRFGIFSVDYKRFAGVYTLLDNGDLYAVHISDNELLGHAFSTLSPSNSMKNPDEINWVIFTNPAFLSGYIHEGIFGVDHTGAELNFLINGDIGTYTALVTQQRAYTNYSTKSLYNAPLSMPTVSGQYRGFMRSAGVHNKLVSINNFTIDDKGAISVDAIQCTFKGHITPHGATGVFDAVFETVGENCQLARTLKGIVTPLEIINDKPKFAVQLHSANNEQVTVFILDKI
jgi:hypothetical protein